MGDSKLVVRQTFPVWAVLLATLLSLALSPPANAAQTEISFYLQTTQPDDVFAQIVSDFERENRDVKVNALWSAGLGEGNWEDGLLTLVAGGNAPDVIAMSLGFYMPLAKRGILADLSTMLKADSVYQRLRPDLFTNILDRFVTADGKVYALPVDINLRMIFYNRDHFARAGIPNPSDNWTFNDFLTKARRLTLAQGGGSVERWGYGGFAGPPSSWISWVQGNGGAVVDRPVDPTRSTFSAPATVEAVSTLVDMIHTHKAAAPLGAGSFQRQQSSMSLDWIEQLYNYERLPDLNYALVPQPVGIEPFTAMGVRLAALSAASKHPDAAYRLARFITMDPRSQRLLAPRKLSWVRSVAGDPKLLDTPPNRNKRSVLAAVPAAHLIYPLTEHWSEMEKIYGKHMRSVLAKETPVTSAAVQIDQEINALLRSAR